MKKILFIFPILAIVLTGCSFSKEPTENQAPAKQTETQTKVNQVVNTQADNTLKIYNNAFYAYSIQYPRTWFVDTTYSEKDFTLRGGKDYIGGDTIFSNYENPTKYNLENPAPADLYMLNLMIYKSNIKTSLDTFIKQHNFSFDKKENLTIGGLEAIKLSGVSKDHPAGVYGVNLLVKRDSQVYIFNYSGVAIPAEIEATYQSVIKSFTVNKEEAYKDWIDFSNKLGGYSFKYPANWKAAVNSYANKNSLFGVNASGKSGTGGVEIVSYSGTLDSYFAYMENEAAVKYSNQEKIVINGVDAMKASHVGVSGGFTVILKRGGEIFSVYINSEKADEIELFNKLVESFKFLE